MLWRGQFRDGNCPVAYNRMRPESRYRERILFLPCAKPNGKIRFAPTGTVKGQDIPESVPPVIAKLQEDLTNLPDNAFVP